MIGQPEGSGDGVPQQLTVNVGAEPANEPANETVMSLREPAHQPGGCETAAAVA
jgi:hypothetical protein